MREGLFGFLWWWCLYFGEIGVFDVVCLFLLGWVLNIATDFPFTLSAKRRVFFCFYTLSQAPHGVTKENSLLHIHQLYVHQNLRQSLQI